MILIYGAAFAGKREIAREFYHAETFCDGGKADASILLQTAVMVNYHQFVRRLLDAGASPQDFTRQLLAENPDILVITDEVGSGVIPMERKERLWREECGICTRMLAASAQTVIRVVCGIPQVLKGELP